jgi:hypothetical protein
VREFCSKHAFKIRNLFTDETIEKWLTNATYTASKLSFKSDTDRCMWINAFVCRECCESPPDGRDRYGTAARASFSSKFSEMMRRREA